MALSTPVAVAATFAAILCWPFFILIGLINELCRLVVQVLLWIEGNGVSLSPNGSDNIFHSRKTYSGKHILILFYCEGVADLERDTERFRTCLTKHGSKGTGVYTKLTKIILTRFGYAALKSDSSFKVSNHVLYYSGHHPSNGIVYSEEEITEDVVPSLFDGMDGSKPQWEWIVLPFQVQRRESGSCESLRILKMHHSYMDGIGCLMLLGDNIMDHHHGQVKEEPYLVNPKQINLPKFLSVKLRLVRIWAEWTSPVVFFVCLLNYLFIRRHDLGPFALPSGEYRKNIFCYSEKLDLALLTSIKKLKRVPISSILATALQKPLAAVLTHRRVPLGTAHSKALINNAVIPYNRKEDFTINRVTNSVVDLDLTSSAEGRINWIGHQFDILFFAAYLHVRFIGRLPVRLIRPLLVIGEAGVQVGNFPTTRWTSVSGTRLTDVIAFAMNGAPIGFGALVVGYGTHFRLCTFTTEDCMSKEEVNNLLLDYVQELRNMSTLAHENGKNGYTSSSTEV